MGKICHEPGFFFLSPFVLIHVVHVVSLSVMLIYVATGTAYHLLFSRITCDLPYKTSTTYNDKCEKLSLSWKLCELKSLQQYFSSKQTVNVWNLECMSEMPFFFFLNAHSMFSVQKCFFWGLANHSLCKAKHNCTSNRWIYVICHQQHFPDIQKKSVIRATFKTMSLASECDMCIHHVFWNFECVQCTV